MVISTARSALLLISTIVSLQGIQSQLFTSVVGVQDIITLLENITDTSTATSTLLPHLAHLLQNQEGLQNYTNLLLQNNTDRCPCSAILQEFLQDQQGIQDQIIALLSDQQINHAETSDLMRNYTHTQTEMANALNQLVDTQDQMEDTQSQMASTLNQSADTQTRMEETLIRMANTQSQMAYDLNQTVCTNNHEAPTAMINPSSQCNDSQTRTEETLTQIADAQNQMVDILNQSMGTQNRMEEALVQIAQTQTQTANALVQVVNLLQVQSQQLDNITDTMTYMVEQLTTQGLPETPPRDCSDLLSSGSYPSGAYSIRLWDDLRNLRVYCDMDTDNKGWTVFQRRFDGSIDFYQGWDAYEDGFGSPDGEYWMGLREIYRLTKQGYWKLRIDLEDFSHNTAYAEYDSFSVGDKASNYELSIGAYTGTAYDSLSYHNNQAFSTKDSDHDTTRDDCAEDRQGAWWYKNCAHSNLNGLYLGASQNNVTGMAWFYWKSSWQVLKRAEMKIWRVE